MALASRHAVPAIYGWREFVVAGGLMSYGAESHGCLIAWRALMPAEFSKAPSLPICRSQQPTTFELAVNLKTAKELGLTVPQSILGRADEVIE